MTPQEALSKTKIQLMSREDTTFFTTVCFSLIHEFDNKVSTAQTNGKVIKFNPDFFMSLPPEEQLFLLIHETLHVALMHTVRVNTRNPKRFNIAADHVINLMLLERRFKMPKNGLADPQYKGMSTEEVYDLLPDDAGEDDFTMDLDGSEASEELTAEIQDIVVRASIQSKMAGDKPGSIPDEIQIFLNKLLNPKLPWYKILRRYIQSTSKSDYSFQRPNRRFMPDHYLPSLHSESLVDLAIAVDTSGSVSDEEFLVFISEMAGILKMMKPEKMTVIQFDTQIKEVTPVKDINALKNIEFRGRGGTEIYPVMEWANTHKPKVLIVFTDGDFYFRGASTKVNTIWLIHNNPQFFTRMGKTIHYEV
jgi:predicted metal-dependent peptidase